MSITTKTGDSGKTSLLRGERVFKDDLRVVACGTLDELCSSMGMAKSLVKDKRAKEILGGIQRDLFVIGAEIVTGQKRLSKLKERINADFVSKLEKLIRHFEGKKKSEPCCFCLPGENPISSSFDISRTIARRAERVLVALKRKKVIKNPDIIIYLNRLSDLLYLFARDYEKKPKKK